MGLFDFFKRQDRGNAAGSARSDGVKYSGGDGSSMERAVVIHATSSAAGVQAEYTYLSERHGQQGQEWGLESQALMEEDGRHFDALNVKTRDGQDLTYYFDISEFFGKF